MRSRSRISPPRIAITASTTVSAADAITLAPFGSLPAVNQNLVGNPGAWTYVNNGVSDSAATFAGTEQTNAAYVMQTLDISKLHINAGLRVENTNVGYVGYTVDTSGGIAAARVHGSTSYTDLFPSVQLKYSVDENTNLRVAVTRGIARPDYVLLAPSINVAGVLGQGEQNPISEGNPALKPEHAWNYDLLGEHYLSSVGVLSAGLFYKSINDFIFQRICALHGPARRRRRRHIHRAARERADGDALGRRIRLHAASHVLTRRPAGPRLRRQLHARRVAGDRASGYGVQRCRLRRPGDQGFGQPIQGPAVPARRPAASVPRPVQRVCALRLPRDLGAHHGAVHVREHLPIRQRTAPAARRTATTTTMPTSRSTPRRRTPSSEAAP